MFKISQRLSHIHGSIDDGLTLDFDTRQKARIKVVSDNGHQAGVFLERGKPLMVGEYLKSDCGKLFRVNGALEPVITATTDDWLIFSKVCYHLGNRHTRLQIGARWLRFKPDHVLTELVMLYKLNIDNSPAIFEPENGAYQQVGHHHHD
jgi:urease accessory protein